MKVKAEQLLHFIKQYVNEAKKDKKKDELEKPKAYKSDSALDYSKPLGDINLYKRQGVANFGPYTESKDPWLALSSILSLGNKKEG